MGGAERVKDNTSFSVADVSNTMKDRLAELLLVSGESSTDGSSSSSAASSLERNNDRSSSKGSSTQWYDTLSSGCDSTRLINSAEKELHMKAKVQHIFVMAKSMKKSGRLPLTKETSDTNLPHFIQRRKGAFNPKRNQNESKIRKLQDQMSIVLRGIKEIQENTRALSSLHTSALTSPSIPEEWRQQMVALAEKTKTVSLQINNHLKDLESSSAPEEGAVRRMHLAQLIHARQAYVGAMERHEKELQRYADGLRSLVSQQMAIVRNSGSNLPELEAHIENGTLQMFVDNYQLREKDALQDAKAMFEDVVDRHNELAKIENSIRDVRDTFVQMAFLLQTQGEVIDNIEAHVLAAAETTTEGRSQLKSARKKKRSARKKKIWLAGIGTGVAVGLLATVAILV